MRAGERLNSARTWWSKYSYRFWSPGALVSHKACHRNRTWARARITRSAQAGYRNMRKGEPKSSLGLESWHSKEMPAHPELTHATCYASCGTLPVRLHAPVLPGLRRSIQKGCNCLRGPIHGPQTQSPGRRLVYAVGAWGNLCKAEMPVEGQTAAHGQITERKVSVARRDRGQGSGVRDQSFAPDSH